MIGTLWEEYWFVLLNTLAQHTLTQINCVYSLMLHNVLPSYVTQKPATIVIINLLCDVMQYRQQKRDNELTKSKSAHWCRISALVNTIYAREFSKWLSLNCNWNWNCWTWETKEVHLYCYYYYHQTRNYVDFDRGYTEKSSLFLHDRHFDMLNVGYSVMFSEFQQTLSFIRFFMLCALSIPYCV